MDKITKNKTIINISNNAYSMKRAAMKRATRLTILLLLDWIKENEPAKAARMIVYP